MNIFQSLIIVTALTSCTTFLCPKSNDSIRKQVTGQDFKNEEVISIIITNQEQHTKDSLSLKERQLFLKKIDKVKCKGVFKCRKESSIQIILTTNTTITLYTCEKMIGQKSTYYKLPLGRKIIE